MLLMFNTWDEIKETLYIDKINFVLVGNLNVPVQKFTCNSRFWVDSSTLEFLPKHEEYFWRTHTVLCSFFDFHFVRLLSYCRRINPIAAKDLTPLSGLHEAKFPHDILGKGDAHTTLFLAPNAMKESGV